MQDLEKNSFSVEDKLKFQIQIYHDYGTEYYEKKMWDETIKICQQAIDLLKTDILKKRAFCTGAYEYENKYPFLLSVAHQKQGN